ncbi:MAG: DEAD/DEAH box helicase, partial [Microbacteriaceae bacterium]|nr:DEAD/DEAH box helicase [Microbacteriaceae bacterium]
MTELLEMIVLQDVNGLQSVLHAMTVILVESGLLRDLNVMIELLVVSGLQSVLHVMTVHLVESGLLRDQLVMTELLVVSGLQSVQLVKKEHLVESGQMTVAQEILVDQIALLEMTTVREVSMVQETRTIAFSVPLITKLVAGGSQPRKPNRPRALVLAPTRELADQIDRTLSQLARSVGFYTTCIYGGMPQRRQEIAMARGVDILVATPGRLEDLMAQKIVDLRDVETLVIDEADHMCDLGFIEPVRRITAATGDSQKMLFSATLDREIDALVREFLPTPYVYEVPNETEETSDIIHRVMFA